MIPTPPIALRSFSLSLACSNNDSFEANRDPFAKVVLSGSTCLGDKFFSLKFSSEPSLNVCSPVAAVVLFDESFIPLDGSFFLSPGLVTGPRELLSILLYSVLELLRTCLRRFSHWLLDLRLSDTLILVSFNSVESSPIGDFYSVK
jgi:hypothetical protein